LFILHIALIAQFINNTSFSEHVVCFIMTRNAEVYSFLPLTVFSHIGHMNMIFISEHKCYSSHFRWHVRPSPSTALQLQQEVKGMLLKYDRHLQHYIIPLQPTVLLYVLPNLTFKSSTFCL